MSIIGQRIRVTRTRQHQTLQQVAASAHISRSLLCKIEKGVSVPPIATLTRIAAALSVDIVSLLSDNDSNDSLLTLAKDSIPSVKTEKGYLFYAFASSRMNKLMNPFLFTAHKGEIKPQSLQHTGDEFVYVVKGRMQYKVGAVTYELSEGDSLYFDACEEHDLVPITDSVTYLAVFADTNSIPQSKLTTKASQHS